MPPRPRTSSSRYGPSRSPTSGSPPAMAASALRVLSSRPKAEDRGRQDPQQPAEDRRGEDDPDERLMCRAEHPAHLDVTRVGDDEPDQHPQHSDEPARPHI